jgi:hypothetical protein
MKPMNQAETDANALETGANALSTPILPCGGVLGFTGTQQGLTEPQIHLLVDALLRYAPREVHHGDCIGADAQFHDLVRKLLPLARVVIHPPTIAAKRAFCEGDEERASLAYLTRNRAIVRESQGLIAAPAEREEKRRSGSWATVREARKQNRPLLLILPEEAEAATEAEVMRSD